MNTFFVTFAVFIFMGLALSLGVISGRQGIKGSCGGLNKIPGLENSCGACSKKHCKRKSNNDSGTSEKTLRGIP